VSQDTSRAPDSAETRRRQSIRPTSGAIDRAGRFGTRYVPGRVVVKFKDGVSALSRASAIRNGSQAAALAARPSYADFDLVQIDPADDPEAVADALSARSDVQYAQADYRVYPHMVPNDPNYSLQWNLPLLDLERA